MFPVIQQIYLFLLQTNWPKRTQWNRNVSWDWASSTKSGYLVNNWNGKIIVKSNRFYSKIASQNPWSNQIQNNLETQNWRSKQKMENICNFNAVTFSSFQFNVRRLKSNLIRKKDNTKIMSSSQHRFFFVWWKKTKFSTEKGKSKINGKKKYEMMKLKLQRDCWRTSGKKEIKKRQKKNEVRVSRHQN